ncbi:hypothetical protein MKW98_031555 [Papaver atlanticum]|uniref:Uncharacterized protein n=1 Tax=Papaver atlanticum TaxID=357466 RepID=A0AAD4X9P1_9MAGN|nr:hypothetical protein MKW98_031555 [Papaver atlanticum]
MEVAMEIEDDLFFADLSKEIALLIMDDDDDHPVVRCPKSVSIQQVFSHRPAVPSQLLYEHTREVKGTGVFIPRSLPRRKNRSQGRSYNNPKSHKQQDRLRGVSNNVTNYSDNNNNINDPSCINCYTSKRY